MRIVPEYVCGGVGSKSGCAERAAGVNELRRVRQIESFGAELDAPASILAKWKGLKQRTVELAVFPDLEGCCDRRFRHAGDREPQTLRCRTSAERFVRPTAENLRGGGRLVYRSRC